MLTPSTQYRHIMHRVATMYNAADRQTLGWLTGPPTHRTSFPYIICMYLLYNISELYDFKLASIHSLSYQPASQPTSARALFYALVFQPALCDHLNRNFFRFPDVPLTSADALSLIALLTSGTVFLFASAFYRQSIVSNCLIPNLPQTPDQEYLITY